MGAKVNHANLDKCLYNTTNAILDQTRFLFFSPPTYQEAMMQWKQLKHEWTSTIVSVDPEDKKL